MSLSICLLCVCVCVYVCVCVCPSLSPSLSTNPPPPPSSLSLSLSIHLCFLSSFCYWFISLVSYMVLIFCLFQCVSLSISLLLFSICHHCLFLSCLFPFFFLVSFSLCPCLFSVLSLVCFPLSFLSVSFSLSCLFPFVFFVSFLISLSPLSEGCSCLFPFSSLVSFCLALMSLFFCLPGHFQSFLSVSIRLSYQFMYPGRERGQIVMKQTKWKVRVSWCLRKWRRITDRTFSIVMGPGLETEAFVSIPYVFVCVFGVFFSVSFFILLVFPFSLFQHVCVITLSLSLLSLCSSL